MGNFYDKITNRLRFAFQFDRIYPTRGEMENNATNDNVYIGRYVLVSQEAGPEDENYVSETKVTNSRSDWQGTVWQKTRLGENGQEKYVFIADLNTEQPTISVTADKPLTIDELEALGTSEENLNIAYFDANDSSDSRWQLHIPALWTLEMGDFSINEKGFNKYQGYIDNTEDSINTSTRASRAKYWDKTLTPPGLSEADDIYSINMILPSIGNTVSNLWDIAYGQNTAFNDRGRWLPVPGVANKWANLNEEGLYRNIDIRWNSYDGIRLLSNQRKASIGQDFINKDALNSFAGNINTTHDLIGMIFRKESDKQDPSLVDTYAQDWDPTKIYFVSGEFYRKKREYHNGEYKENLTLYKYSAPDVSGGVQIFREDVRQYADNNGFLDGGIYKNFIRILNDSDVIEGAKYWRWNTDSITPVDFNNTTYNPNTHYYYSNNQTNGDWIRETASNLPVDELQAMTIDKFYLVEENLVELGANDRVFVPNKYYDSAGTSLISELSDNTYPNAKEKGNITWKAEKIEINEQNSILSLILEFIKLRGEEGNPDPHTILGALARIDNVIAQTGIDTEVLDNLSAAISTLNTTVNGLKGYGTVKVGTTNITAGSKSATLILTAGDNITLTPDNTNKKVTIAATMPTVPTAGTTAKAVSTTASGGSATTWSKSDHVHNIALATGDSNGQVKIAGTNVSVKGLGSAAYTASTAYIAKPANTAKGDILYWSAASTVARLAAGSEGKVLKINSNGVPAWADDSVTQTLVASGSDSSYGSAYPIIFSPTPSSTKVEQVYKTSSLIYNPKTYLMRIGPIASKAVLIDGDGQTIELRHAASDSAISPDYGAMLSLKSSSDGSGTVLEGNPYITLTNNVSDQKPGLNIASGSLRVGGNAQINGYIKNSKITIDGQNNEIVFNNSNEENSITLDYIPALGTSSNFHGIQKKKYLNIDGGALNATGGLYWDSHAAIVCQDRYGQTHTMSIEWDHNNRRIEFWIDGTRKAYIQGTTA